MELFEEDILGRALSGLLQSSGMLIFVADHQGRIQKSQGQVPAFLPPVSQGLLVPSLLEECRDSAWIIEAVRQCLRGEEVRVIGERHQDWLDVRFMPYPSGTGEPTGILGLVSDITASKRAECQLRQLNSDLRHAVGALEFAVEGMLRLDNSFKVLSCNLSLREMLGGSEKVRNGCHLADLFSAEDRPAIQTAIASISSADSSAERTELEVRIIRNIRSGRSDRGGTSPLFLRMTLVPARSGGRSSPGYFCYLRDITDRKRLEAQLLHADRMVAIGTLASGIAHEVNNPLTFITANLAYIESALGELPRTGAAAVAAAASNEGLLASLQAAAQGAERIRNIVHGLKSFCRSDLTQQERGPVRIESVLETALQLTSNEIRHRATIIQDLLPLPPVQANASSLVQVFVNLLVNAAQAIPDGELPKKEIRLSSHIEPDGRVAIRVADTGVGIPESRLKRIFDPFYTTKSAGIGRGLGLSICHGIVSELGGEIRVESRLGEGSTFTILLPSTAPRTETRDIQPSVTAPEAGRPRMRVLVIDDERLITESLQRILKRDYDVTIATGGQAGLDAIMRSPDYAAIFCDLMMPDLTGMDLFERIEQSWPALQQRFIFMTGGAFTVRSRKFIDEMTSPCIEKPFDLPTVRSTLQNVLKAQL